jgi:molybdate transport system substrate-binding protein
MLCALGSAAADAESTIVAVAANFLAPAEAVRQEFEARTDHEVVIVSGSTGQLYTQIVNGAPFDILLAADQARPEQLAKNGLGDTATRFTYAVGRLALWTREPAYLDRVELDLLENGAFRWLAIANPDLAPYGVAAREMLTALDLWQTLQPRIVQGQNVGQAFAMTETGNAELGLIALSQAMTYESRAAYITVPRHLHAPIRQDAILLRRARSNQAARAFIAFLDGPVAAQLIDEFGYAREQ